MRSRAAAGPATLLDAPLLERVLSKLPADDLASAQLCCSEWANVIHTGALWRRHCTQPGNAAGQAGGSDWRQQCLHQHAAQRWREGHAVTVASKHAHTAPITAAAALGDTVLTGSSDGSAALWHLAPATATRPTHYSLSNRADMQHRAAVVAVALASDSLAVCATAQHAFLWREDKCIRQFKWQQPGPNITHVACAETHLVVAYADGSACVFDLYSGSLQLILRIHKSPISALLLQDMGSCWGIITGAGGEVACSSISNGACLWRLGTSRAAPVCGLAVDCGRRVLCVLDEHGEICTWQATHSLQDKSSRWKLISKPSGFGTRPVAEHLRHDPRTLAGPSQVLASARKRWQNEKMRLLLPEYGRGCVIASNRSGVTTSSYAEPRWSRQVDLPAPAAGSSQSGIRGEATAAPLVAAASGVASAPAAAAVNSMPARRGKAAASTDAHDRSGYASSRAMSGTARHSAAGSSTWSDSASPDAVSTLALTGTGCVVTGHANGCLRVSRFMTRC